jgi:hypothetical protein
VRKSLLEGLTTQLNAVGKHSKWPTKAGISELQNICFGSQHDKLDAYMSAWVASLAKRERIACGQAPLDVIWIPRRVEKSDEPFKNNRRII